MKANGVPIIRPNEAPQFRVLLATPTQNGQVWGDTAEAILRMAGEVSVQGIDMKWERISGLGLPEARNEYAAMAVEQGFHAVIQTDSDIVPKATDTLGLIRHGKHLIGALYRHKTDENLTWCANFIEGEKPDAMGALRVKNCGAGFQLYTTNLLRAMVAKGVANRFTRGWDGRRHPHRKEMFDFFSAGVFCDQFTNNEPTFLTEDFAFAHRALLAGHQCYVDTQVRVPHLGVKAYRPDVPDMPEPWKVAPAAPAQS